MMAQNNQVDVICLVRAVEKRSAIYDRHDANYSNRPLIRSAWRDIAAECGTDEDTARRKWASIRDYFLKFHKRRRTDSNMTSHRKWYLYDHLNFLVDCLNPERRETSENTYLTDSLNSERKPTPENVASEAEMEDEFEHGSSVASSIHSRSPSPAPSEISNHKATVQARKHRGGKRRYPFHEATQSGPSADTVFQIINSLKELETKRTSASDKFSEDCDGLFLRSLMPHFKSMDDINKMECKIEIQQTILKFMKQSQRPYDIVSSVSVTGSSSAHHNSTIPTERDTKCVDLCVQRQ